MNSSNINELSGKEYAKTLTLNLLARWVCIIEGVNVIMDKMEEYGMDDSLFESKTGMNNLEKAIQKYIKERFNAVRSDILIDHTKIEL